jgi:hypothetical protein
MGKTLCLCLGVRNNPNVGGVMQISFVRNYPLVGAYWIGPGGWKCFCCGPKPGLDRKKTRRRLRRVTKLLDRKENQQ